MIVNEKIAIKICEQMKDDIDNLCDCCRKNEKNRTCIGCRELAIETILKENARLKDKFKDLEEWLEAMASMYENEYKDVNASEHYKCMLYKLKKIGNNQKHKNK